jgi:hypothetical protein
MIDLTPHERRITTGMLVIRAGRHPTNDDDPSPPAAPALPAILRRATEQWAHADARRVPIRAHVSTGSLAGLGIAA